MISRGKKRYQTLDLNAASRADGQHFIMLRYETEYTPCTGITAVSRQERKHFPGAVTIAPWCPEMSAAKVAIREKKVEVVGSFRLKHLRKNCTVYKANDAVAPLFLLSLRGHFDGVSTPYDTPRLKEDSLVFGLAVEEFLKWSNRSPRFVWCADWETIPALLRLRQKYRTVLTLHNAFDECLADQAERFKCLYPELLEERVGERAARFGIHKTALEIGLEVADAVTTVNRGFAWGIRSEVILKEVVACHLQEQVQRIVGVNNGNFAPLINQQQRLLELFRADFAAGKMLLFETKTVALESLPEAAQELKVKAAGKVIIVSMGRLVSQKLHDIFVEALRRILTEEPAFPLLAFFATVGGGDADATRRYARIQELQAAFPENIICSDQRIPCYGELMAAADYNCMPSLYEPHGGAFEGTVIPIARAVDGLAEQICPLEPNNEAARMASMWHAPEEAPTGFLFREKIPNPSPDDCKALLIENPPALNALFLAMVDALTLVVKQAVDVRQNDHDQYARLVMAALEKQEKEGWKEHLEAVADLPG